MSEIFYGFSLGIKCGRNPIMIGKIEKRDSLLEVMVLHVFTVHKCLESSAVVCFVFFQNSLSFLILKMVNLVLKSNGLSTEFQYH